MLHFPKWQIALIVLVSLAGCLLAMPNLFSRDQVANFPDWLPAEQINLGLDLQGGSHLLLEVAVDTVIEERLTSIVDEARVALRGARIGYTGLGAGDASISATLRNPADGDRAMELLEDIGEGLEASLDEGGVLTLRYTEDEIENIHRATVKQSVEIIRRRVDETGTREPTIQRQGDDRVLVQLPGIRDPERIKALLGQTAKLNFHIIDSTTSPEEARAGRLPPGSMLMPSDKEIDPVTGGPNYYVVRKRVVVSGDTLVDSQPTFQDNQPVVSFRFDNIGGRKFGDITKDNVGKRLAIVLDGEVISAPVIREPILGGSGVITGSFSVAESNDLALLLRAGALPAPLTILEERSVGPSLGADSVAAGQIACIIGFILVAVVMALVYGLFGLMANIALILNMVLVIGVLSLLQATLTLPGIAGIVLTLGMAVDANVLIFERIREETARGRTPVSAVDAGHREAMSAIIDANVTTLIAALFLFQFGTGPVKGFAVTLSIGIVTSMFAALMITRFMVVTWLRRRRPASLPL